MVWAPEKRQGSGLGQAGPLSLRVVALSWVTDAKRTGLALSRDVAPNRDTTLEPGWLESPGLWGPQQATLSSRAVTRSSNRRS